MNINKYEKLKANQSMAHMQTSVYTTLCEYLSAVTDSKKGSLFYDLDRELKQYIMSLPPLTPFGKDLHKKLDKMVEVAFYLYPQHDVASYKLNMVELVSKIYMKSIRDLNKSNKDDVMGEYNNLENLASKYYKKERELNNYIEKEKSNVAFNDLESLTEAERALAASTAGKIYVTYMTDVHAMTTSSTKKPMPFNADSFENLYPKGLRKAIETYTKMLISATHPHLL